MALTVLLIAFLLYVFFKNIINLLKFLFFVFVAFILLIGIMIGRGCSSMVSKSEQNNVVHQLDTIEKNI